MVPMKSWPLPCPSHPGEVLSSGWSQYASSRCSGGASGNATGGPTPPARACKARMSANCGNTRRRSVKEAGAGARGMHVLSHGVHHQACADYLWWCQLLMTLGPNGVNRLLICSCSEAPKPRKRGG